MTDYFHDANRRRWNAGSASWVGRAEKNQNPMPTFAAPSTMPVGNGEREKSDSGIYPSCISNRWIAEALIEHRRVIDKIRADTPAGELALQDIESFNDQPIARGVGDTAPDAIKTTWPLTWRASRQAEKSSQ